MYLFYCPTVIFLNTCKINLILLFLFLFGEEVGGQLHVNGKLFHIINIFLLLESSRSFRLHLILLWLHSKVSLHFFLPQNQPKSFCYLFSMWASLCWIIKHFHISCLYLFSPLISFGDYPH